MPTALSRLAPPEIPRILSPPCPRRFVRGKALGTKFRCLIISDGLPHWLLALRPMDWSYIHWMQFHPPPSASLALLESFLPALKNSLFPATFDALQFVALLNSVDVMLVSGSAATMHKVLAFKHIVPTLCVPSKPSDSLSRNTFSSHGLTFLRMRHRMLGGVTNGNLPMGSRGVNFCHFKPPLRRTVKHVLDFSVRPSMCEESPPFVHYQGSDVLRMADL
jgi:hypothetical protein